MKRAVLLTILLLSLAMPSAAHADIAPPGQPPGANVQPGTELTQVRMAAETVLIAVEPGTSVESLGLARVTADFTMHNTGTTDESMAVRFPIGADNGWGKMNEITEFRVQVAGQGVSTRRVMGGYPGNWSASTELPWAEFDVTFPAQQDLQIRVQYTLQGGGEFPFSKFTYILSTGAGWKDTIGSADIILQLPYQANIENVLLDSADILSGTTRGGSFDGNTIRWHYSDLEPTASDNFEVNLVAPYAWRQLLAEQDNVAQHPTDGESWGRIGKLCKQMAFSSRGKGFRVGDMDPGAAQLYSRSLEAYKKAVSLLPRDALWHAGYADALAYHAYFQHFSGVDPIPEALHAMSEINIALQLSPNDPTVVEIAQEIWNFFPEGMFPAEPAAQATGFVIAWLTATPTQAAITEPSSTTLPTEVAQSISPTASGVPPATITSSTEPATQVTPLPSSKPSSPICSSALGLPLVLIGLVFVRPGIRPKRP